MGLKCGIVGLTNSGKTTMFNCISNTKAAVTEFAYSTNKSNIGVCAVPDERLANINTFIQADKLVYARARVSATASLRTCACAMP